MKGVLIQLNRQDYDKCLGFSSECTKTTHNHYKNRSQQNISKLIEDAACGKFAELAVYNFIHKNLKLKLNEPDFNIYERKHKTFNSDLLVDKFKVHVKSCKVNSWDSWTFQYSGNGVGHTDSLFVNSDELDFVSFCQVDINSYIVHILGFMNVNYCKQKSLFKLPILEKHFNTKRVIYYNDIKDFDKEILWSFVIQAEKAGLLKI